MGRSGPRDLFSRLLRIRIIFTRGTPASNYSKDIGVQTCINYVVQYPHYILRTYVLLLDIFTCQKPADPSNLRVLIYLVSEDLTHVACYAHACGWHFVLNSGYYVCNALYVYVCMYVRTPVLSGQRTSSNCKDVIS
jgi:hypothetical protein